MTGPMRSRGPHATLRDVAAAAGVSTAAVSRHLNGSIKLPADTTRRIDSAVRALNYQPNLHARRLVRGRTDMIALVVPDIGNLFFAYLAAAVEEAAAAKGIGVTLHATANLIERELGYIELLSRHHVDALLFITNHTDDGRLAAAVGGAQGLVLLDEDIEGTVADKVFSDNRAGGRLAAGHLLEHGHRRLAYVGGPPGLMGVRERGAGFWDIVGEAGAGGTTSQWLGSYTAEHGRAACAALFDGNAPPTAIFAGSDQITLGVLQAARERGLRIGADVSLITFDDASPLEFFDPAITAVRQPIAAMGRRGVEMALEAADPSTSRRVERLPVQLIRRASVGPPSR